MEDWLKEARAKERAEHMRLEAEGKCASTPGDLVGPNCEFDLGHKGRHSWGAFFEPDGSFHATDPDGPYPPIPTSAFMPPYGTKWIT